MEWTPAKKAVAACAAIGLGLLIVSSRKRWRDHNGCPIAHALDPDLDVDTRRVVMIALEREHDPAVLHTLSAKLAGAGHDKTAQVVRERAVSLLRVPHVGYLTGQIAGLGYETTPSRTVRTAQLLLQKIGYAVPVTGIQDDATTLAVKRFQSLHDLDIDGIIDEKLLNVLRAVSMHTAIERGQSFMEGV